MTAKRKHHSAPAQEKRSGATLDEAAKFELDVRAKLYQFYLDSYIKGVAIYLGITGLLLKYAVESQQYRNVFCIAGIFCELAILVVLIYAIVHERTLNKDFKRLAEKTATFELSTRPLLVLSLTTACFWLIILGGWIYVLWFLRGA